MTSATMTSAASINSPQNDFNEIPAGQSSIADRTSVDVAESFDDRQSANSRSPQTPQSRGEWICLDPLDGWQDFELLPASYRSMRNAKQLRLKWTLALALSLLLTGGSLLIVWTRQYNLLRRQDRLIVAAQPIAELQQQRERLEHQTKRLRHWCQWVESARPDDSLAQVIGALIAATNASDSDATFEAQSLSIKLPLHRSSSDRGAHFSFVTKVGDPNLIALWTERLRQSPRLDNLRITSPQNTRATPIVRIDADPIAAKPIP